MSSLLCLFSHSQQPDKCKIAANEWYVTVSDKHMFEDETKSELPAAVAELDVEAVAEPDANPAEQKTVKTAAQKKAEKKEREKKKREAQQTKQKKHGQQTDELEIAEREPAVAAAAVSVVDELELPVANEHPTVRQDQDNAERDDKKKKKKKKKQDKETTEVAVVEEAESMVEGKQADVEEDVDEEGGDEDDKKKKKKKKKKGEKEKEVTAAKGKGKKGHLAMVQQIREVQEKLKQEEERLKAEEEARQKEQEEKERLEQEKVVTSYTVDMVNGLGEGFVYGNCVYENYDVLHLFVVCLLSVCCLCVCSFVCLFVSMLSNICQ